MTNDTAMGLEPIKNCPFCGSDELSHGFSYPPDQGVVQCHADNCGGAVIAESEQDAIAAWNRRALSRPATGGAVDAEGMRERAAQIADAHPSCPPSVASAIRSLTTEGE